MTTDMRGFGYFRGAGRAAALSAAFFAFAGLSEAAVPEATAPHAATGEYRAVVDRLVRLERELNDLQRATYSRLAARRTGPRTANDSSYAPRSSGVDQRISDLETSLRSLTGRLEEVEYEMRQLKTRMNRLASSMGPGAQTQGGPETASGPGSPKNLAATMPGGSRRQPGAGSMPSRQQDPGGGPAQPDTQAVPPAEPVQPGGSPRGPVQPGNAGPSGSQPDDGGANGARGQSGFPELSGDEGRDFNRARELLLKGEFARAGDMFGAITKAYPKSKLAGDSQFWRAESLFVRELYKDAAQAYLKVARDFPDSAKAPDSLVKLAVSFDQLGERKQACAALGQLDRRYPKAPEKVRQNAERYKNKFSCG